MNQKRPHRATGVPKGGKRPGSGRPKGATNTLEYGEVKAVKAAGLRVPKDATEGERELADESLERIAQVMRGEVFYQSAASVLKAAVHLRTEICGPIATKLEHSGPAGEPISIVINRTVVPK